MKLLTINTHSLQEVNYRQKLTWFVETVRKEMPDIIAMQEVNQSVSAPLAGPELLDGYSPCPDCKVPIRQDNHAANAARLLAQAGLTYFWTWVPAKIGYGKYDEGLALLSLRDPISEIDSFYISQIRDYQNWRTRKVLGIRTTNRKDWFYTVHMGWWQDEQEPFLAQWQLMERELAARKKLYPTWLMGDFNSPAEVLGQGYDCIRSSGWQDSYTMARKNDEGLTVAGVIDGWREYLKDADKVSGMRIDHIWCSKELPIKSSRVIFNGKKEPIISDHFGVLVETEARDFGGIER